MKTENLVTVKLAAEIIGVSTQRVYAMAREGKIKYALIGGVKFFDSEKLKSKYSK